MVQNSADHHFEVGSWNPIIYIEGFKGCCRISEASTVALLLLQVFCWCFSAHIILFHGVSTNPIESENVYAKKHMKYVSVVSIYASIIIFL